MCGGTYPRHLPASRERGLSPRVRGNHEPLLLGIRGTRSIPACAGEPQLRWTAQGRYQVYPRVCGGTISALNVYVDRVGLSPRVRGNLPCLSKYPTETRSIPACAGEPAGRVIFRLLRWVYPRVCGGTICSPPLQLLYRGLSPRVRGNHPTCAIGAKARRSIPACAGEPCCDRGAASLVEVYPRVCGGTSWTVCNRRWIDGLSPRVRGNLPPCLPVLQLARSIPACAGEP